MLRQGGRGRRDHRMEIDFDAINSDDIDDGGRCCCCCCFRISSTPVDCCFDLMRLWCFSIKLLLMAILFFYIVVYIVGSDNASRIGQVMWIATEVNIVLAIGWLLVITIHLCFASVGDCATMSTGLIVILVLATVVRFL
jgi:hypothetical protein